MLYIHGESIIDYNIFNAEEDAIIVTVNTVGAMGRGIALECKERYPAVYERYHKLCKDGEFTVDKMLRCETKDKPLILFPTKEHWRNPSNLSNILYLCKRLPLACEKWGIKSVAIPPLGLANGWLKKESIKEITETLKTAFEGSEVKATLYLPANLRKLL
jgi:O-acetyl-ADP-ribose deacetylase (regulator of RNase III)